MPTESLPDWIVNLPRANVISFGELDIRLLVVIALVVVILFQLVLMYLPWGRRLYAIGSNPDAAGTMGLPVQRTVFTAFVICGALAGLAGDKWSLGFVAETEKQVEGHLDEHLEQVPEDDRRTRAILKQMKLDEIEHGRKALDHGGAKLPAPLRSLMQTTAKIMTTSVYRV